MKRETIEKANKILEKMEGTKMIKLKDIAEKYGEYELDENKLKEILIEPRPKKIWDLKKGDKYYTFSFDGSITTFEYGNDRHDEALIEIGIGYVTEEEAKFERERLKVEAEMLKYGGTRDMMSLGDENIKKYFIEYYHDPKQSSLCIDYHWMVHHGMIYFKSEEDAKMAIARIGEGRIKKYIFNVKE